MRQNQSFLIVTPTFNSEKYLEETILSVLTQVGNLRIRYHVQDGGSQDGTLEILNKWSVLLQHGNFPIQCDEIDFSYAVEKDEGMYDAINKAFSSAKPDYPSIMSWINSDDRLAPGALSTVAAVLSDLPDASFVGGRVSLMNESGCILGVNLPFLYNRTEMRKGLYDGRTLPFVMQEGTFWRSQLWEKVRGLDKRFRLAGDWDLWRRFAACSEFTTVDTLLGFHRRRPGQLSSQMDKYYYEIDNIELTHDGDEVPQVSAEAPHSDIRTQLEGSVARFDMKTKSWSRVPDYGLPRKPPIIHESTETHITTMVNILEGARPAEGPYPEWNLPRGIRWMNRLRCSGNATIREDGRWTMVVQFRNWRRGLSLRVSSGVSSLFEGIVGAAEHERDITLRIPVYLAKGENNFEIYANLDDSEDDSLIILLISWHLEKINVATNRIPAFDFLPSRYGLKIAAALDQWPRISIVVPTRNQETYIRDTLKSIVAQCYPNLELIIVDGNSTDNTMLVVQEFADYATYVISEPDLGQSDAINKGFKIATGDILTWLNSDDCFADGALFSVAFEFMRNDVDVVAGICTTFDDRNRAVNRHLPSLRDGVMPIHELLDLSNCWLKGKFFHQPEVFFSKRIWNLSGGNVDVALFYSMDYDLWVRMAKVGARASVIGRDIAYYRMHEQQKTSAPEKYLPELTKHAQSLRAALDVKLPKENPHPQRNHLRITMFNDYGFKYGAGIAHRRLNDALSIAGHSVSCLAYADFDRNTEVSGKFNADDIFSAIRATYPDLVIVGNLHAIRADFIEVLELLISSRIPTVFFAHDEWLITGRCAYHGSCQMYHQRCDDHCPTSNRYPALEPHLIGAAFDRKRALLAKVGEEKSPFSIFTNSTYMKKMLDRSIADNRISVSAVQLGIEIDVFKNQKRANAREILGVSRELFVVMTSATSLSDERKGFHYLIEALNSINPREIFLIVLGNMNEELRLPYQHRVSGYVDNINLIALHYSAADVFVGPSREEALGQTFLEAAAAGVPSIAFDVGGVSDAIQDGRTGLLVDLADKEGLKNAILLLYENPLLRNKLGAGAQLFAEAKFSLEAAALSIHCALHSIDSFEILNLVPNTSFDPNSQPTRNIRYISGDRVLTEQTTRWEPGCRAQKETSSVPSMGIKAPYAWLMWPNAEMFVFSHRSGELKITIVGRCPLNKQDLDIGVNGKHKLLYAIDSADFSQPIEICFTAQVRRGFNRLDIAFSNHVRDAGEPRPLAFLVENVKLDADGAASGDETIFSIADGNWEVISGFSYEEGPYKEAGLPSVFRWTEDVHIRFRIFSQLSRERTLRIAVRNYLMHQGVEVLCDGMSFGQFDIPTQAVEDLHYVDARCVFEIGWCEVILIPKVLSEPDPSGRRLAFIAEEICFLSDNGPEEIVSKQPTPLPLDAEISLKAAIENNLLSFVGEGGARVGLTRAEWALDTVLFCLSLSDRSDTEQIAFRMRLIGERWIEFEIRVVDNSNTMFRQLPKRTDGGQLDATGFIVERSGSVSSPDLRSFRVTDEQSVVVTRWLGSMLKASLDRSRVPNMSEECASMVAIIEDSLRRVSACYHHT